MSFLKKAFSAAVLGMTLIGAAAPSQAAVVYSNWNSNESPNGNYVLSVAKVGSQFNWNLTVDPWNAEALGLFVDLGAVSIGSVGLSSVSPSGQISVFATDTSNNGCGGGCNLGGLNSLPALGGGDWELVFSLGNQGWDGIQTFSWTTNDFGLTEAAFGTVAIRAQQLCSGTALLPNGNCGDSDKAWGTPDEELPPTGGTVPEPMSTALVGLGLLAAAVARRRRA